MQFSTQETWLNIKEKHQLCSWHPAMQFKHSTPKYLASCYVVQAFNPKVRFCNLDGDASCVLCQEPLETIDHLFFKCPYSRQRQVWETLINERDNASVHSGMGKYGQTNYCECKLKQSKYFSLHIAVYNTCYLNGKEYEKT